MGGKKKVTTFHKTRKPKLCFNSVLRRGHNTFRREKKKKKKEVLSSLDAPQRFHTSLVEYPWRVGGCHFIFKCIYSGIWHFKQPLRACGVTKQANFLSYSIGLRLYHVPYTVRSEDYPLCCLSLFASCSPRPWTWTWESRHRFICMPLLWWQGKYSHRQPRCPRHYPCAVCLPTS